MQDVTKQLIPWFVAAFLGFSMLFTDANAGYSDWSKEKRQLFWASNLAIAYDINTTMDGSQYWRNGLMELNPILGPYPTDNQLFTYMIVRVAVNYAVADWLKPPHDTYYLGFATGVHYMAGYNNSHLVDKVRRDGR